MHTKKLPRDAVTGRIVTAQYAAKHPKTTVVETVKSGKVAVPPKPKSGRK